MLTVDGRKGLVQEQEFWRIEQGTTESDPLSLSPR